MAEKTNSNMLFANFNQDFSCISVGTRKGYSVTNCDPFGRVYTMNDGARGIVEMLFCTSLIVLVGAADQPQSSPRKLQIVNTKRQSMICELLFPSSILAVKLNRKSLVIVLENEIYIYDISNMRLLHVIETTPNPEAICALSPSADSSYLAYPSPVPSPASASTSTTPAAPAPAPSSSPSQSGDVLLFSTRSLTVANVIQAHKSPLSSLAINSSGTLLATASEKGTVIRVWSVPGAEKLYQFRRGTREARIYSMNFNVVGTLLAVSSAHDTVHVFKLGKPGGTGGGGAVSATASTSSTLDGAVSPPESVDGATQGLDGGYEAFIEKKKGNSVSSSLRRKSLQLSKHLTHSMGGYLPSTLTEMWEPSRDFAFLRLPTSGARSIVALSGTMPHVMVLSAEGYFYLYSIDLEKGGECVLMKQYKTFSNTRVCEGKKRKTGKKQKRLTLNVFKELKPTAQKETLGPESVENKNQDQSRTSLSPSPTTTTTVPHSHNYTLMPPAFNQADSDLITQLHGLNVKLVRSSLYNVPMDDGTSIGVRSWKMNEFKYYDIPSPFPTLARGLFTRELDEEVVEGEKKKKKHQIVIRGYDKFFNIGEVPWTTWASLESHTAAPYTLSLKSNGCIIFFSALTPNKLLVTSKHSLGAVEGAPMSHAQAGEGWLRKYLEKLGKTEADLAGELWEKNWTAIAELCDDSFEEHVLGYPPEKTGLHLHGLNVRTKDFITMPADVVDAFADAWGFIKTPTITLNSIKEVKDFTTACAETGEWNGEQVEGFVVRTHVTEPPAGGKDGAPKPTSNNQSPYKPGSSFFFKVKFDEPYMMYRDWREVTKMLLSSKSGLDAKSLPKSKMKRPETKLYVRWVIREIKHNPGAFKEYTKGKGIIATRERFLEWMKSENAGEELKELEKEEGTEEVKENKKKFEKTIIVPVAIPGSGKTAVSIALSHLFGFAHTQSDDIQVKKAGPAFIRNVRSLLDQHDVVIADKNNHLTQHRDALRELVAKYRMPVRLLALNWPVDDKPPAMVHRICCDRVLDRGANHQTLRADPSAARAHEEVVWSFIREAQPLAPVEADEIVDMSLDDTLEEAVERAMEGVVRVLGVEKPSKEKVSEALEKVKAYEPAVKKADGQDAVGKASKAAADPRYFGLLPEIDIVTLLDECLAEGKDGVDPAVRAFWEQLKADARVARRPHITIVHRNGKEKEAELWARCSVLHTMSITPPTFKGKLTNVLCNERVMALTMEELEVADPGLGEGQEGAEFVSKLPEEVRNRLHITVGTKAADIPPVEAMSMVMEWREKGKVGGTNIVPLEAVSVRGRVKGLNS
ncbi:Autophagy-related protein 18 [Psilocybe cubensis]|uniref:Autophagy-related protein 18 n=2 Tax=Psilocybe cubensis TaxID=181762 RepID=A0ACB8GPP6_PSICU|nr:Autophagy-related protein 18 [Psilocybe cubensis]KAH9477342.1 Autophagy-related protein 18 [Psilocybe cubensis]